MKSFKILQFVLMAMIMAIINPVLSNPMDIKPDFHVPEYLEGFEIERGKNFFKVSDYFDDKKSDREILQTLFDQVPDNSTRVVYDLEGYEFIIDSTIVYHKSLSRITIVEGNGARIEMEGDYDILIPDIGFKFRVGAGGVDDISSYMDAIRVYNVDFSNGRTQLRIVGTLQSEVKGCRFLRGQRGLQVIFGLQTLVSHNHFSFNTFEGCVFRSGLGDAGLMAQYEIPIYPTDSAYFSNATGSNSQSNRSIIEHCRFYATTNQRFCFRNQASDEVQVNNCIFEGSHAQHGIYHDSRGSTTVRAFQVNYPHIEHGHPIFTRSLIYVRGGIAEIRGIYPQHGGITIVESDASQVYIERPRYMLWSDSTFVEHGGGQWAFYSEMDSKKLGDPKHWNGTLPRMLAKHSIASMEYLGRNGGGITQGRSGAGIKFISYGETQGLIDMAMPEGNSAVLRTSIKYEMDMYNKTLKKNKKLRDYDISYMKPVKMKDSEGVWKVIYIPYFSKK